MNPRSVLLIIIGIVAAPAFADCIVYNGQQYCNTAAVVAPPPVVYYPPAPVYAPPVVYYPPAPVYAPPAYYGYTVSAVNPLDAGIALIAGAIGSRIIWGNHRDYDGGRYHHRR